MFWHAECSNDKRTDVRSTQAQRSKKTTVPVTGTALLLIDVVNDLAFPGSEVLVRAGRADVDTAGGLQEARGEAGVPIVYVNDNFGQWRSDFRRTVAHCCSRGSPGRAVSRRLKPTAQDYFVLKPKHSGFYDTTLETLLSDLGITRSIVTGIAGNICALHRERRLHARAAHLRAGGLHRLEYCRRQRVCAAADRDRAQRQDGAVVAPDVLSRARARPAPAMTSRIGAWIDRLTLVMLALFGLFLAGQVVTGWYRNSTGR